MRLLSLTPWRRGPSLLLRRPGVAAALFAAGLVAALPAAAAPLFLSSAQHATLHRQIDQTCPWFVGMQYFGMLSPPDVSGGFGDRFIPTTVGADRFRQREEVIAARAPAGLSAPESTGYGQVRVSLPDRPLPNPDLAGLLLMGRDGFADHVEVLAGPAGTGGLWLSDEYAHVQQIEVGDELELALRRGDPGFWQPPEPGEALHQATEAGTITVPVTAIYRDLRSTPDPPYWCGVAEVYRGSEDPHDDNLPPPAALMDTETLLTIGAATGMQAWQIIGLSLADPRLTAPEAELLAAELSHLQSVLVDEHPELFPTGFFDDTVTRSELERFEQRAALVRTGIFPPVAPITAAGTLVGLAVTGAAAFFWVQRRRRELAVLANHGVGAGSLGIKAVLEAVPAIALGAAAGWATAWALIGSVGPSAVLAPGTVSLAALATAGTGVAALLVVGVLSAVRARTLVDTPPVSRHTGRWRRVPWELTLLAAAAASWPLLSGDRVVDTSAGGVGSVVYIPPALLVTPLLIILAGTVFAARLAAQALQRHGPARTPKRPAWLLAWRRSTRAAVATTVLAVATAVPVAMAAFGATATDTIHTTAEAKLQYNLGSDTVVSYPRPIDADRDGLPPPPPVPAALEDRATEVLRLNQQRLDGLHVDVLAIDPATFAAGAFWDPRIPGPDLQEAVEQVSTSGTATVVASRRIPPGPATLTIRNESAPVEVAATRPLPGAQAAYPMIIIDRAMVEATFGPSVLEVFTPQVWIAGDPEETLATAAAAGLPLTYRTSIDEHRVGAVYEPVTYTFQYLTALSVFTGLISAIGLLLYLESRTAALRRGYVMLRRLGLRPRHHRRAVLLEVGAPVAAGLGVGIAAAIALGYALRSGFDLNPARFPSALLVPPTATATVIAVAALTIAAVAALVTHHRIHHTNAAEVLRDTP